MNPSAQKEITALKFHKVFEHQTFFGGLSLKLPLPDVEYHKEDVHFSVYCVKHAEQKTINETLRHILLEARHSYKRYGEVPLLDAYDEKSSIYLTRVVYPVVQENITFYLEEWLSVRFVPAGGTPALTEDLRVCLYKNRPLSSWMQEKFLGEGTSFDEVTTISRLCRISPRAIDSGVYFTGPAFPQKNNFTAISFLLMAELFFKDSEKRGKPCEWLSALAKPELFEKILCLEEKDSRFELPFFSVEKVLDIPEGEISRLDRSFLSYRYPGYFLNLPELFSLFQKLLDMRRLSQATFHRYVGNQGYFEDFFALLKTLPYSQFLPQISGLPNLFLGDEWIEESRMHKTELRSLCDLCVTDAVKEYLTTVSPFSVITQKAIQSYFS